MARVLVIEPDRRIGKFVAGILSDFGHQVHLSGNPGEAPCLPGTGFDVVVTDQTCAIASFLQPLPVLTLSGCCLRSALQRREVPARLREKPFRLADLRELAAGVAACEPTYAVAA
jgi:hypothetical protein